MGQILLPEVSLGIIEVKDEDGLPVEVMCMEVATASTMYTFPIATKETYEKVAGVISTGIMAAGGQMKAGSRLVTNVRELPNGLRKRA